MTRGGIFKRGQGLKHFLLEYILPSEDLEDVSIISKNISSIEDYDFEEVINKYDINDYIVTIIYKNNNQLRILSKVTQTSTQN